MNRLPEPGSPLPVPRPVPADGLTRAVVEGRRRQAAAAGAAGSAIFLIGVLVVAGSTLRGGGPADKLQPAAPAASPAAPEPQPVPSTPSAGSAPTQAPPGPSTAELSRTPAAPSPQPAASSPPPAASSASPAATAATTPPPAPATGDPGAELRGRQFTAFERTRAGQPEPFVQGTTLAVQFGSAPERSISWRAGCNSAGAEVDITPDRLLLSPIASTAIGCDEARQRQDERIAAFFASDPAWRLAGGELVLTSADVVIRLRQTG